MPKAKKLKSGSWNVMVFSHMEGNKRKYASFTASTKDEALLMAAEFKAGKKRSVRHDLKVSEAVSGYIAAKEGVLSPATVRGYRGLVHYYEEIGQKRVRSLSNEDMQLFVSDLSKRVAPKSVRNVYGFLVSCIRFYKPDAVYSVTLPQMVEHRPTSPEGEDIKKLCDASTGQLHTCILLGIRGMRRGEICALKYEDIKDGVAHIHADMVKSASGEWIYKEMPKTSGSDRFVRVPDLGKGEGFIVKWTPDSVTKRFIELRKSVGVNIRFHDLRHFFASTGALIMPDIYLADMGGWSRKMSSSVMKSVYQNNMESMSEYYSQVMEQKLREIAESRSI